MLKYLSFLLLLCFCCIAQTPIFAQQNQPLGVVAFYNVENLFDTENDSTINDEEFLPEGENEWTEERYQQKLQNMARVIQGINGGPDILGLCEIENRRVVQDLVLQPSLKANRYQIIHFDSPDYRGVDVALVYKPNRFIPFHSQAIALKDPEHPKFLTRDILYVKGLFEKDTINIFVNHWPSRRGGKEDMRILAAQLLRQHVDSILRINPTAKIIMMGDFNDDPANNSIKNELKASMKEKKMEPGDLFNTSAATFKQGYGTLGYQGVFNLFDQIIISQGLLQGQSNSYFYIPDSYKVFTTPWMQDTGKNKGFPRRTFSYGVYQSDGFSDHFPVLLMLGK